MVIPMSGHLLLFCYRLAALLCSTYLFKRIGQEIALFTSYKAVATKIRLAENLIESLIELQSTALRTYSFSKLN